MHACPSCGAALDSATRFCPHCGTLLERTCSSCGAGGQRGRFCGDCGTPLAAAAPAAAASSVPPPSAPVAERRVTSVLFGDLVGFTPLSESRDAEEVRELLSRYFTECRTVIGRYGGTVEKFIGDAVMAVWGVPTAHEDDAERAVRAGLELVAMVAGLGEQVGAPDLAMRVGIVTGEVAVTIGATAEGMVAGDAVNTASRVQATAAPGQVWVDDTTRTLTSSAIAYADTGEHTLKGKTEPMRLWRARAVVASIGGVQRLDGLMAPMVGRDRELRLVKELFHATHEGGRPRLVVVDGEPGVGKSRLVAEFDEYVSGLHTVNAWWHRGRCLSYGDGVAFWALAEALRPRFGLLEGDTGAQAGRRFDERLAEYVPDERERTWLRPRLAVLLGLGESGGYAREDLFAAWTALFESIGSNGDPVVWVIDDAQYADDGLLDFVEHLLATARVGIVVVALARPELLARRPQLGGRRTTVVRLDPLDHTAMGQLLDGLVVGLPQQARTALVHRAEGVPLFAVETVRALIDRDLVVARDGVYVPTVAGTLDLGAIGAPASLQALVAARLDALTPAERRVVTDASVLGAAFTRDGLLALADAGTTAAALDQTLAALQRREIVRLEQDRFSAERGQYRFVQSVVRQVAYSTQSRRDRRARHLAAAAHLATLPDADDLAVVTAQHLLDAVDASSGDDSDVAPITRRARDLLRQAGTRAQALGSPAEACRLFEAALARTHEPTELADLHLAIAHAAQEGGSYDSAVRHATVATEAFDRLAMPVRAGVAVAAHGRSLMFQGENAAAIGLAEQRHAQLRGEPEASEGLERLTFVLTAASLRVGAFEAALHWGQQFLLLAEEMDDPRRVAQARNYLGLVLFSLGAPSTALALVRSSADYAREHALDESLATALVNLSAYEMARDLAASVRSLDEAAEPARRCGDPALQESIHINLMVASWLSGDFDRVADEMAAGMDIAADPGSRPWYDLVHLWWCEARGVATPPAADTLVSDDEHDQAMQQTVTVEYARAGGALRGVIELVPEALRHALAGMGLEEDFQLIWPPLVLAALTVDDLPLAERLLEPVESARPSRTPTGLRAQHRRLRGLVRAARGDDPTEVEADLREGISLLVEYGWPTAYGPAQEELGDWLARQGRTDEAAEMVAAARATYERIGAVGWLARLEQRLSDPDQRLARL